MPMCSLVYGRDNADVIACEKIRQCRWLLAPWAMICFPQDESGIYTVEEYIHRHR